MFWILTTVCIWPYRRGGRGGPDFQIMGSLLASSPSLASLLAVILTCELCLDIVRGYDCQLIEQWELGLFESWSVSGYLFWMIVSTWERPMGKMFWRKHRTHFYLLLAIGEHFVFRHLPRLTTPSDNTTPTFPPYLSTFAATRLPSSSCTALVTNGSFLPFGSLCDVARHTFILIRIFNPIALWFMNLYNNALLSCLYL